MTIITLKDFMECTQYKITEGSTYGWACYGPDAYNMDFWNQKHDDTGCSISVIFDTKTQVVYEMQAWDYANHREYRWIHPDYLEAHKAEADCRGVDFEASLDDSKFIDLDVEEDILKKATAIAAGKEYDTRITITLNLDDETKLLLMTQAHEADMTLNHYVEHILREAIAKFSIEK
jgi:predicted HicB family RNase H-like nuclease